MSQAARFELAALKGETDPYGVYDRLRAHGPVQRMGSAWLVLGHAEATAILRSTATRSGFIADGFRALLPPGAARDEMAHRINFLDPPDHTRVRALVSKAFTPRRTRALAPFIERLASELLTPLAGQKTVDLVESYAHPLPSLVISELLGVPTRERHRLTELADRVSNLLGLQDRSEAEFAAAVDAAEQMHATLRALLEERRLAPRDDLLSALLAAEQDDARLAESELLSLAATLYSAGHRTTRDLFTNGLTALLERDDLLAALRAGDLPTSAVVEEFLRFETPTHYVSRMLAEPLELAGYKIPPGEAIVILLAAGNRDPAAYPDAHHFDPWRWTSEPPPPPPLSFAFGAHFCLGASLARLEAATMLDSLLRHFPELRATPEPLDWRHTGLFRSVAALPVVPGPLAASSPDDS